MKTSSGRYLLVWLAIGWVFLVPGGLLAKSVEFPADDPAFGFKMPDDWKTEKGEDGRLYCTAPDGFKIVFVSSPGVKNAEDAGELLPKTLQAMSDKMKCEEFKKEEAHVGQMGNIWMTAMEAHGKVDGTPMSLNAVVFSLDKKKYFTLLGAATEEVDKAHNSDMNELIQSIAAAD